jgi:hypothetical protein
MLYYATLIESVFTFCIDRTVGGILLWHSATGLYSDRGASGYASTPENNGAKHMLRPKNKLQYISFRGAWDMEHGTLRLRSVGWQTRLVPFGRSEPCVGWTQNVFVLFVIDMHAQGDIYRDCNTCIVGVHT